MTGMRSAIAVARVLLIATAVAIVAACGGSSSAGPSSGPAATPTLAPVPGNSVAIPLPTDAPASLRALPPLPSCGTEVLFEEDVDITPVPTPPGPTTAASQNQQAMDCLMTAWANGTPAEMVVSEATDEADQIYSIYRLPGDGTIQLTVRVLSHADQTIAWTQTSCTQLAVQDGGLVPSECQSETPIN